MHVTASRHVPVPRLRSLAAVTAAAAGVALAATSAVAAPAPGEPVFASGSGNPLLRFAPIYMGDTTGRVSQDQAVALAREFDLIAAHSYPLGKYVRAMRAANPKLIIVGYVNGTFSTKRSSYPESAYAHDKSGRRITTAQFGQDLMNPASSVWRSQVASACSDTLRQSGFDGCFLDSLGEAPFAGSYVTAPPVDPSTGRVWDRSAWMAATSSIVTATSAANPRASIASNGLTNGQLFFDSEGTAPLAIRSDAAMAELWLRGPTAPVTEFKTVSDWRQDVDMLTAAEKRGSSVITTTKVWGPASQQAKNQWHRYALASFLLGTSGHSYFSFSDAQNWQAISDSRYENVQIGTPTGSYAESGGAYRRAFTNGFAVVNPASGTVRVALSGSYVTLDGRHVSGTFTLGGHDGDVLVRQ